MYYFATKTDFISDIKKVFVLKLFPKVCNINQFLLLIQWIHNDPNKKNPITPVKMKLLGQKKMCMVYMSRSSRLTDEWPSYRQSPVCPSTFVPSLGLSELLGWHPVFHWACSQAVANFPVKFHGYHQMSLLVMSHPPHVISHLNSAVVSYKSDPSSRSQSVFG